MSDLSSEVDALLDELERRYYEEPEEWAVRLLSATYLINRQLQSEPAEDKESRGRLEKWLKRLFGAVKQAAGKWEAVGFSISVGFPAGVTVTVEWNTGD